MTTYFEVAKSIGLENNTLCRYIQYMLMRWKDTENQKCNDGYAIEWAYRFLKEIEYQVSDEEGIEILKQIDGKEVKNDNKILHL
jgi:hypothetical protein